MTTFSDIKEGDYVYIISSGGVIAKQRVSKVAPYNDTPYIDMKYTKYMLEADPDAGCLRSSLTIPYTMLARQTKEIGVDAFGKGLVACASTDALKEVIARELEDIESIRRYFKNYLKKT